METIRGKHVSCMDASTLAERRAGYASVHIDIGTGDGRFVRHIAQLSPNCLVIGIDTCRENLREVSRRAPANALFVIANAQQLPPELHGLAAHITINFPWGSLLEGLLTNDPPMLEGFVRVAQLGALVEARLNGGALAKVGWSLEPGTGCVKHALEVNGFQMRVPLALTAHDLRECPTTWAKRLAFGRDPRAMYLRGTKRQTVIASAAHALSATTLR